MLITIGECKIEIDENATLAFYAEHGELNSCGCSGCRNFREAVSTLPPAVHEFFKSCGIDDLRLITEIIPYVMQDGLLLYGGFFHVVGRMSGGIEKTETIPGHEPSKTKLGRLFGIRRKTHTLLAWSESKQKELAPRFSIWFKDAIDLPEPDLPENTLQIEIQWSLEWVLDEPCEYRF